MHALQAFRYAERLFHSQFVRLDFHRLECRGKHFNHIDVALFENVQSFLNHGLRIQHTKHVIFLELPPIIRHVEHGHSTEAVFSEQSGLSRQYSPVESIIDHQNMRSNLIISGTPVAVQHFLAYQRINFAHVARQHKSMTVIRAFQVFLVQHTVMRQQPYPFPLPHAISGLPVRALCSIQPDAKPPLDRSWLLRAPASGFRFQAIPHACISSGQCRKAYCATFYVQA